jgi:hypothetical protein
LRPADDTSHRNHETAKPLNGVGRPEKGYDRNLFPSDKRGNSTDYLTRRIARDRPDILERLKSGEIESVRQAAIEAGILPKQERIHVYTHDPVAAAHYLAQRVDAEWMQLVYEEYMRVKAQE